ncbi:uncharacterized protein F4822DRAFT_233968 [Hypoxylon trugodes]|uniref:uncharacterized protein n=1 Tax=Hypoxylon trugodes TaxID=326681 RepID=UPI00219A0697|nr:uncharacterized protein F4822DRAFT_233968 [Hypoxylon trugodes]KAI1390362.1 hypothetical protein F4822DRAFT_233968 [Hypoxylon trugodes]
MVLAFFSQYLSNIDKITLEDSSIMAATDLRGKTVFVVGGSGGLGKEMSKVIAAQGAHITIFSRNQEQLDDAKNEILAVRQDEAQKISAVAGDMGTSSNAHSSIATQPSLPDILYCVAGGTPNECGFLLDLTPEVFERCMTNNYYSSVYPAQAVLKQWVEDDSVSMIPKSPKIRKIIFVNSSASLVPAPGYLAYSAAKAAQRALADTTRLEAMRYSNSKSTYIVQYIFAHNFITPTFIEEQKNKPELTKQIEGTTGSLAELEKSFPYAAKIAPEIVAEVASNNFAITDKRVEPQFLWANMIGTSPKRGFGIIDSLLAFLGLFVYPFLRREMEQKCRADPSRNS